MTYIIDKYIRKYIRVEDNIVYMPFENFTNFSDRVRDVFGLHEDFYAWTYIGDKLGDEYIVVYPERIYIYESNKIHGRELTQEELKTYRNKWKS